MRISNTITGHYQSITIQDKEYEIYYEEAGQGIPIVCLHTAVADSRQYAHLLRNNELTSQFRVIAFDLPYHGRSLPPDQWWLEPYQLTDWYVDAIMTFTQALPLEQPIMMGCSRGGNITLELAYRYPEAFRDVCYQYIWTDGTTKPRNIRTRSMVDL